MIDNKFCAFYVNEAHLITMLLPYIKEKMNENYIVKNLFEKDMTDMALRIIEGIFSKKEKDKLKKIEWKTSKKNIERNKKNLIIVVGSEMYIKEINEEIKLDIKEEDIIINCFEFNKEDKKIIEILNNHSKIINTKGEVKKEEMFTQFTQKARKSNKEITIMK